MKHRLITSLGILALFLYPEVALGCGCLEVKSVAEEFGGATVVFSGKAVSEEYVKSANESPLGPEEIEVRVIRFEVERWWKGEKTKEVVMYTDSAKYPGGWIHSSCDYYFRVGERYLVYAFGSTEKLKTHACARTKELSKAEEDLKTLGEGNEPEEEKSALLRQKRSLTTHSTRRLDSISFIVVLSPHVECSMLGAG